MPRLLCIMILLTYCVFCKAQEFDETNFVRYTKLDGLSNNYIRGIVQDAAGYIWIATEKGLNRFDGKFFSNFFKNSENSPIPENLITSLGLQNQNELIGTTGAGAFAYNTVSHQHKYFIVPSDSIIYFWANQGWQALKDRNGNYIVSTKTGLYVFNPQEKILCRYDYYNSADAGRKELWFGNWLCSLSNGGIFQENNLSGSLYYPETNKIDTFYSARTKQIKWLSPWKMGDERISFYGMKDELFLPNAENNSIDVYNLVTGKRSSYFVSTSFLSDLDWYSKAYYINDSLLAITSKVGGFYLVDYSPAQNKFHCSSQKYFASKYCTSILKDSEGRLWIGTNDGLYKQNIRNTFLQWKIFRFSFPPSSIQVFKVCLLLKKKPLLVYATKEVF